MTILESRSHVEATEDVRVDIHDLVLASTTLTAAVIFIVCIFLSVLLHWFRRWRTRNNASSRLPRKHVALNPIYTIERVVKPVEQPVGEPVKYFVYTMQPRLFNWLFNRSDNRLFNRLYRVNGVLYPVYTMQPVSNRL